MPRYKYLEGVFVLQVQRIPRELATAATPALNEESIVGT